MKDPARALATGGAGFLGSQLCQSLRSEGVSVACLDRLITGDLGNIKPLMHRPDLVLVRHDVANSIEGSAQSASPGHPQGARWLAADGRTRTGSTRTAECFLGRVAQADKE